jgi:hypothetical protein
MKIDYSSFDIVSNAFNVLEISEPIRANVSPDDDLVLAWGIMMEYNDWCCLVKDKEKVYGYLIFDDEIFNAPIQGKTREATLPLNIKFVVPSTMSILDVIPIFLKQCFLFVLASNDITHVITFQDLDKLPVKLCIFSLFLELEKKLLGWFSTDSERYLNLLPKGRLEKAKELCRIKKEKETPNRLLLNTTFIDKKTMLMNDPGLFQALSLGSKEELVGFFDKVEKVRNKIAHSDSILEILRTPEEFNFFINDLRNKTNIILNY